MRKTVPFLVIAALTLGCRDGRLSKAEPLSKPCPGAGNITDPPIVCVTGNNMVSQKLITLSVKKNRARRIGLFFAADNTSNLTIACEDPTAVSYVNNGSPHVVVVPLKEGHFTYTVVMGLKTADPEMQIDP